MRFSGLSDHSMMSFFPPNSEMMVLIRTLFFVRRMNRWVNPALFETTAIFDLEPLLRRCFISTAPLAISGISSSNSLAMNFDGNGTKTSLFPRWVSSTKKSKALVLSPIRYLSLVSVLGEEYGGSSSPRTHCHPPFRTIPLLFRLGVFEFRRRLILFPLLLVL